MIKTLVLDTFAGETSIKPMVFHFLGWNQRIESKNRIKESNQGIESKNRIKESNQRSESNNRIKESNQRIESMNLSKKL